MYRSLKDGRLIGTAGELRVATELILRKFVPFAPFIDNGVDLMLLNGMRLQVKTASLTKHKQYEHGVYRFDLSNHRGNRKSHIARMRDWSKVCDFLILWAIDEDRFFIVPPTINRACIWIGHRKNVFHCPSPEVARKLRDDGCSWSQIARTMGICFATAKHLAEGTRPARADEFSQQVLKYEDAWHLLDANAIAKDLVDSVSEVKVQQ